MSKRGIEYDERYLWDSKWVELIEPHVRECCLIQPAAGGAARVWPRAERSGALGMRNLQPIRSPARRAGDRRFFRKFAAMAVRYDVMAHSYTNLLYHILFSTKNRKRCIGPEIRNRIHQYIGGTIRALGGVALEVNGVEDHVHAAAKVPPSISISDFLGKLKVNTSKWAKRHCRDFTWQEGYTAFTVSESQLPHLREYIRNQEKHHRKMTFQEELAKLLKAHRIRFDEE